MPAVLKSDTEHATTDKDNTDVNTSIEIIKNDTNPTSNTVVPMNEHAKNDEVLKKKKQTTATGANNNHHSEGSKHVSMKQSPTNNASKTTKYEDNNKAGDTKNLDDARKTTSKLDGVTTVDELINKFNMNITSLATLKNCDTHNSHALVHVKAIYAHKTKLGTKSELTVNMIVVTLINGDQIVTETWNKEAITMYKRIKNQLANHNDGIYMLINYQVGVHI